MKRFILSTALALAMGNMASAQKITGRFDFINNPNHHFSFSVPKEFSYNGAPRLILSSGIHDDYSFLVYNENIEQVKSIKLNPSTFDYQLTYKVEDGWSQNLAISEISLILVSQKQTDKNAE